MATGTQERKQAKPLPPPNSDFYELAETLGAEEHALLKQLRAFLVPLEGAGGNLKSTISGPFKLHGIPKVSARRAPELGEHNDKVLEDLGFNTQEVDGLRAGGAIPKTATRTTAKA